MVSYPPKRWEGGGGGIFLNPNFTGRCRFLIAYGGQLDRGGVTFS